MLQYVVIVALNCQKRKCSLERVSKIKPFINKVGQKKVPIT